MPWWKESTWHGYYYCFSHFLVPPWPFPVLEKSGIACSASASTPAWLLGIKCKGPWIVIPIDRNNCHAISCEERLAFSSDGGVLGWVCMWRENNGASNLSGKVSNKRTGDSCSGPWTWHFPKMTCFGWNSWEGNCFKKQSLHFGLLGMTDFEMIVFHAYPVLSVDGIMISNRSRSTNVCSSFLCCPLLADILWWYGPPSGESYRLSQYRSRISVQNESPRLHQLIGGEGGEDLLIQCYTRISFKCGKYVIRLFIRFIIHVLFYDIMPDVTASVV
jgi:hypothetical protein